MIPLKAIAEVSSYQPPQDNAVNNNASKPANTGTSSANMMFKSSVKGQLATRMNTTGSNPTPCPKLQDNSACKCYMCGGLGHISNNCPDTTKVAAGQVVPDHDNNIDDDPYKGLQYEEVIDLRHCQGGHN
jgi:hypothetical protein